MWIRLLPEGISTPYAFEENYAIYEVSGVREVAFHPFKETSKH